MPPPETVRVLMIEDNAATAVLQKRALERAGYETIVANSVQQAVEAIRRSPVHVVLLDNLEILFDTDLAHPTSHHKVAGFDVDTDIELDNEPPELRD